MRARCSQEMRSLAPQWLHGCRLRECWFEPTFHKHVGKLCAGVQIHAEDRELRRTTRFVRGACRRSPSRRCERLQPDYPLWRDFPYEYEQDRLAIDVINGSPLLREWVDDPQATPADLDAITTPDEAAWRDGTRGVPDLPMKRKPQTRQEGRRQESRETGEPAAGQKEERPAIRPC